jgi:hypothetical protein
MLSTLEMNMNRFLAAMAFAILAAPPAIAQSYSPDLGTGHVGKAPYADTANGANAYAQAPRVRVHPGQSSLDRSDAVIDEGGQVEVDPDVNIQSQLRRENYQN